MNNNFKIEQISTDQYVLRRKDEGKTEYITDTLDVIQLGSIGSHNEVVFNSLNLSAEVLRIYNSKQLLKELRKEDERSNVKSIKFNYKMNEDRSKQLIAVTGNEQ